VRDHIVEQALDKIGVEFEYQQNIPWGRFNIQASRANQARLGEPLNLSEVERYAQSMRAGYEMPAVVCYEGPGGLILNGGNHRQAAAETAGVTSTDIYLLKTKDQRLLDLVTRCLNALTGAYTPNAQQRLRAAVEYRAQYPEVPAATINTLFGTSERAIREYERKQTVLRDLGRAKVAHVERISQPALDGLHTLKDSEPVMVETAKTIATFGLKGQRADNLIQEVRAQKSDKARLDRVRQWSARLREEGHRPPPAERQKEAPQKSPVVALPKPIRDQVFAAIDRLQRLFDQHPSMAGLQLTHPDDERRFRDSFASVVSTYRRIVNPGSEVTDQGEESTG
jgi:hypothetical protein